jgi:hypothetical protein
MCYPLAYASSLTQLYLTWLRFWGYTWYLVESKWCHYIMVEADSHLSLLPPSISDIYKAFQHIDVLSIGIEQQPYTVIATNTTCLRFWGSGWHMCSQNDVITSWLRLTATSNCFPHPCQTYTKCLSTCHMLSIGVRYQPYTLIPPTNLAQILRIYVVTCRVKMLSLRHGWGWQPPQPAPPIHLGHIQSIWSLWSAVHRHM